MLTWIRAGWTIASFPVRAAWRGYSALWWAFEDDAPKGVAPSAKRPANSPGDSSGLGVPAPQASSGASPGARLPDKPAKPVKSLKTGFVATLVTSAVGAWAMAMANHEGALSDSKAVIGGVWILAAACVVSLLMVRRSERRRALREAAPTPINTIRRGFRQAASAIRERGTSAACAARARAVRVVASAGLGRLVR